MSGTGKFGLDIWSFIKFKSSCVNQNAKVLQDNKGSFEIIKNVYCILKMYIWKLQLADKIQYNL